MGSTTKYAALVYCRDYMLWSVYESPDNIRTFFQSSPSASLRNRFLKNSILEHQRITLNRYTDGKVALTHVLDEMFGLHPEIKYLTVSGIGPFKIEGSRDMKKVGLRSHADRPFSGLDLSTIISKHLKKSHKRYAYTTPQQQQDISISYITDVEATALYGYFRSASNSVIFRPHDKSYTVASIKTQRTILKDGRNKIWTWTWKYVQRVPNSSKIQGTDTSQ